MVMARGWESKSVEEQQSEAMHRPSGAKPKHQEQARMAMQIQGLQMQRSRVQQQLQQAENPRFIELMRRELQHLEHELQRLRESRSDS